MDAKRGGMMLRESTRRTRDNTALAGVQRYMAKGETHWTENTLVMAI
jgi:hypothetical protein